MLAMLYLYFMYFTPISLQEPTTHNFVFSLLLTFIKRILRTAVPRTMVVFFSVCDVWRIHATDMYEHVVL